MITLLTCTGDRQHLFHRLERWMMRQSVQWTNWIVVDDGLQGTECTLGQRYLRLEPGLPPSESFAKNMHSALLEHDRIADSEYVFVVEDDDWYGPNYLASLSLGLMTHDLAGEPHAPYYNVRHRSYSVCANAHYAALCATAFRAKLIAKILPLIDPFNTELDRRIWERVDCSKHLQRTRHCVGLKGQGGRWGLCAGHVPTGFKPDPDGTVLGKWIGDDAAEVLLLGSQLVTT
jgi:hypothetical protein